MTRVAVWDQVKYKVYGVILIMACLSLMGLSLAQYNQSFKDFKKVTLLADRAGLQMYEGNRVKIDGVDAGQTGKIENLDDGSGVSIELKLFPDVISTIPANVEISLEQLTAFGNKAVQMRTPAEPSEPMLAEGDVIDARGNAAEINNVLQSLADVLQVVEPAKLNVALGNIAHGLEGNGDAIGETVTEAARYLRKFNAGGDLENLQKDLRVLSEFSQLYADVAPNLIRTLENASTTFDSVIEGGAGLDALLLELTQVGVSGGDMFRLPLPEALQSVLPVTDLLGEYSPALACFLQGADMFEEQILPSFQRGIRTQTLVTYGVEPYEFPEALPEVGPSPSQAGPKCYGLPAVEGGEEHLANGGIDPESLQEAQEEAQRNPLIPGTPGIAPGTPLVVQLFGGGNPVGVPPNYGGGN